MNIYLAGPIDFSKEQSWKNELINLCKNDDVLLYDPNAYSFNNISSRKSKYIHDVNMFALEQSECVVARWVKGEVSIGTPIELYYAVQIRRPIILITDMVKSVYLNYILSQPNVLCAPIVEKAYGMILQMLKESKSELLTKA